MSDSRDPIRQPDDSMQAFFRWLHHDPEEAGRAYERLHRKLQLYFEGYRDAAAHAAELADTCIDRAARKLAQEPKLIEREPRAYVFTVAGYILLEYRRRPRPNALGFDPPVPSDHSPDKELRFACLTRCLGRMTDEDRELVLGYYAEEKRGRIEARREQAGDLGASMNTLRVRVYRIRRSVLAPCVERCLARAAVTYRPFWSVLHMGTRR